MEKVKELIKWESEANHKKVVQVMYDPPAPKKIAPFFRRPLQGKPSAMAISRDSIFVGLDTGEIQIIPFVIEENKQLWHAHNGGIEKLFVSKDNKVVGTAMTPEIKIWMLNDQGNYEEKVSIALPDNLERWVMNLNAQGQILAIAKSSNAKNKLQI